MSLCQDIWGGIRLSNEIDHDLGLWGSQSHRFEGKLSDTPARAKEMGFKVVYGHLSCIALVASRWH